MANNNETDFVTLLKLLYKICYTLRNNGSHSLDSDIKDIYKSELLYAPVLWKNYSENMERLIDLLRMMSNPDIKLKDLRYFWKQSYKYSNHIGVGKTINAYYASINDCIWGTMRAHIKGYSPEIAVEFGRCSILNNQRIRYPELLELIGSCQETLGVLK